MSPRIKYGIFAIGLMIFGYLVYGYGISNIVANLQQIGWWFLPIVLVWVAVYGLNALAWFVILRDHRPDIRFFPIFRLSITAFALNYITPFLNLGGEPYRVAALNKTIDSHKAISSVILYNMIRWVAHFLFWMTAIAVAFFTITVTPALALVLALVFAVLIVCIWFFLSRLRYGIFESLLGWMSRRKGLRGIARKLDPHRTALHVIDAQIRQLYQQKQRIFLISLAFEYTSRIIASYEFLFILIALGGEPTFLQALYINAATSFILNMLFFVPFELGAREGGLLLVMQGLAFTHGIGIFIGLVNRLRELVWILIGMGLMLKTDSMSTGSSLFTLINNEEGT